MTGDEKKAIHKCIHLKKFGIHTHTHTHTKMAYVRYAPYTICQAAENSSQYQMFRKIDWKHSEAI